MYGDSEATERENRQLAHHQDALYEDDGFDQWGSVHFDEIDAEDDDAGPPEGLYDEYLGASTAVAFHGRGSTTAIAAVLVHAQQQQHEAEAAAAALANVVATNLQLQAVSPWVPMEDGPEEPLLLHAAAAGLTAAMACWAALQVPLRVWRALLRRRDRRTAAAQALRNRFAVLERNGGPAADMQLLVAECRLHKRLPESDVAAMQGAADLCSLRERAHALCERASAALQRVQRLVLDSGDEQLHALSTGGGGGAPVPLAALARELSEMIAQCREREAQLTDEVVLLEAREHSRRRCASTAAALDDSSADDRASRPTLPALPHASALLTRAPSVGAGEAGGPLAALTGSTAAAEEALECGRRYVSAHLRGHSLRSAEAALRRARALRLFDGADAAAAAAAARRLVAELRAARQRSDEQLRQLIADVS
ncbi:hypothetical protein JKP88DRAFT_313118 [Tribonema minus]|uniref:Vezatin n=1 Tax=Tribonema minus TaxID=303371 RepID=A0A835Z505_9STRA|nr:hypothetical protein JKP88DRAFT_313118 [Tribonema minus]